MSECFRDLSPAIAQLDMEGVVCADRMFSGCSILRLGSIVNTESLVSANEMFRNSNIK